MTLLVDPKLKISQPIGSISNESLMSKSQVEELIVKRTATKVQNIKKISGSVRTTMVWIGNTIYVAGYIDNYIFGCGDSHLDQPQRISNFDSDTIVDISCGERHAIVVLEDGSAWCSGSNVEGQLGNPALGASSKTWQEITGPWIAGAKILRAYCIHNRTFLLVDESGLPGAPDTYSYRLFASGRNNVGQCGNNTTTNITTWEMVLGGWVGSSDLPWGIDDFFRVAGNLETTWVVTQIFGWAVGRNTNGELADGSTTNSSTWIQSDFSTGIPGIGGSPSPKPVKIFAADRAFGIVANTGKIYFTGYNGLDVWGSVPPDTNTTWTLVLGFSDDIVDASSAQWTDYAASRTGVVALRSDGQPMVIGLTDFGVLMKPPAGYITNPEYIYDYIIQNNRFTKVWHVGLTTFISDTRGNLWACGYNSHSQCMFGNDKALSPDGIEVPRTVSKINDARLFLALEDLV